MSKLDDAIKSYHAFEQGEKSFADLETAAVYETPFYLRYPISEEHEHTITHQTCTIQDVEDILNIGDNPKDRKDALGYRFMSDIMENDTYSEDLKAAVGNGLIKKFNYKLDDEQSGRLYVEATRDLTREEQAVVQKYLLEAHSPETDPEMFHNVGSWLNICLGHDVDIDVFNTKSDAKQQTDFQLSEIPLETYLSRMPSEQDDFAKAVESLSTEENMSL